MPSMDVNKLAEEIAEHNRYEREMNGWCNDLDDFDLDEILADDYLVNELYWDSEEGDWLEDDSFDCYFDDAGFSAGND